MTGFALQWKTKLDNTASSGAALSGGIVTSGGLGITLAFLGAQGNRTIAIDMDNGHAFFNRVYSEAPAVARTGACLSASLATPTRATPLTPPMPGPPTPAGQAAVGPNSQLPYSSVIRGARRRNSSRKARFLFRNGKFVLWSRWRQTI